MKKVFSIAALFAVVLAFYGCTATSKAARNARSIINGNWQLTSVEPDGITGQFKAEIFDEADVNCFIGTTWYFNNNNSLGSYTLNQNAGSDCKSLKRDIRWSVTATDDAFQNLQFKRLDQGLKEMDPGKGGYIFRIISLDEKNMKLKSDFSFEGKPASFIYSFVKI